MTVSSVTSAVSTQATTTTSSTTSESGLSSDFETFLKMMTVQMQNQDPLNPVESTDFAVQLAAFSQVEQQVLSNEYLQELTDSLSASGLAGQARLIGRSVLTSAATHYDGGTIEIIPSYDLTAESHVLVIRDDTGAEVGRRALSGAPEAIQWSGMTDENGQLGDGTYSFAVESYTDGALSATNSAQTWGAVNQVTLADSGVELTLEGGSSVYETEVTAIR
ncbi:flagellar hook capping FlgD N-terminal domain-containing protein [Donghicola sp. XS_ASV15]|uniref:flagellar hook capping FlgD N-terminal domain-containing protein n=1 Tax=Donghicola sp. XS_ASV15 TaxID=3241295 RepID=UPI003512723A